MLASLFITGLLNGQEVINLSNPSFEDAPRIGTIITPPIKGWNDCGLSQFPGESPPDIFPTANKGWGVDVLPKDGNTYLSLVVRDNHTWESVSQALETELKSSKCYTLKVYLCRSDHYQSRTKKSTDQLQNFITPAVLQIWGGNHFCEKQSLLAVSKPVQNNQWQLYSLFFQPEQNFKYITLEAFYNLPADPYNGHLLIDGLSPIIETECSK